MRSYEDLEIEKRPRCPIPFQFWRMANSEPRNARRVTL